MPSNHLILCHPLLLPSIFSQPQGLVAKACEKQRGWCFILPKESDGKAVAGGAALPVHTSYLPHSVIHSVNYQALSKAPPLSCTPDLPISANDITSHCGQKTRSRYPSADPVLSRSNISPFLSLAAVLWLGHCSSHQLDS